MNKPDRKKFRPVHPRHKRGDCAGAGELISAANVQMLLHYWKLGHFIRALTDDIRALRELLSDPNYEDRALNAMKTNDSIALKKMKSEKISQFKKLPNDISAIGVFANAVSESMGYVSLEYSFSNANVVQSKADSVF